MEKYSELLNEWLSQDKAGKDPLSPSSAASDNRNSRKVESRGPTRKGRGAVLQEWARD